MNHRCLTCRCWLERFNRIGICRECFLLARNGQLGTTVWLPVAGEPRYEVSNKGEIRNARTRRLVRVDRSGRYPRVTIRGYRRYLHVVIAEAWLGPRPEGMQCLHADDDSDNCRIENLSWGTRSENAADAVRNNRRESP
ncbi:hypothetical protein BHQ19_18375 [Mycolicibacterium porcinum]|nr:hypothetical protein BHQ19_18375 [Mycolicibacterium porcinum]